MLQTTVASRLSEPLPEIELKASDIGRDEIAQLIKSEEVEAALQVIATSLADMFVNRVLARLGTLSIPSTTVSSPAPTVQTTVSSQSKIEEVLAPNTGSVANAPRKKRQLTPEAKARISASQKKRWENRERHLTPEAKAKISESQRKRWASKNGTSIPVSTPRESESTEADCQPQHNNLEAVASKVASTPTEAALAVREGYKGDPFYIAYDGHYIGGDDGFVVPANFDEFMERYPDYIEKWVRRRLKGSGIEEDIEDWVQDMFIHIKYLPTGSKHRLEGKEDVIQTFDPFAQYGASERRWRNYINYCLANKFNTIHGKRMKNPVCRSGNVSLVASTDPEIHGEVTDEYIYSNSTFLADATNREEKKQETRFFAHKFIEYVQSHDPDLFPVLEAVYVAGSSTDTIKEYCQTCKKLATTKELEAGDHKDHEVGMSPKDFNRARNRLKQLAALFLKQRGRKPKM